MHGLFILNLLQCLSSYCTLVITCIKTIIGFVQNVPQRFILAVEEVITLTKSLYWRYQRRMMEERVYRMIWTRWRSGYMNGMTQKLGESGNMPSSQQLRSCETFHYLSLWHLVSSSRSWDISPGIYPVLPPRFGLRDAATVLTFQQPGHLGLLRWLRERCSHIVKIKPIWIEQ